MKRKNCDGLASLPARESLSIVSVCEDSRIAEKVNQSLTQVDDGQVMAFRQCEQLVSNMPAGGVDLLVLTTGESPRTVTWTLRWMRRRWPKCLAAVVASGDRRDLEQSARESGAFFFVDPPGDWEWKALLSGARKCRQNHLKTA